MAIWRVGDIDCEVGWTQDWCHTSIPPQPPKSMESDRILKLVVCAQIKRKTPNKETLCKVHIEGFL